MMPPCSLKKCAWLLAVLCGLVLGLCIVHAGQAAPPERMRGQGGGWGLKAPPLPVTDEEFAEEVEDYRLLVKMPAAARKTLRDQMKEFLSVMAQLQGLLAQGAFEEAADLAETKMGRSARGHHQGPGFGPGRYMPVEMRQLAWGLHEQASEFANTARTGDPTPTYQALQRIQGSCVACHFTFRTY